MIELAKETRQQAVSSIERYFLANMEEKIGNVAAAGLLGFFLEEIGPAIHNQAVRDVQERIQRRVEGELLGIGGRRDRLRRPTGKLRITA